MKKYKNKIVAGVVIAIVLAFVFWYGGDAPGLSGWTVKPKEVVNVIEEDEQTQENSKTVTEKVVETTAPTESAKIEVPETPAPTEPVKTEEPKPPVPTEPTRTEPPETPVPTEPVESEQNISEIQIKESNETETKENKPQNAENTPMIPTEKEALTECIADENETTEIKNGDKDYSEEPGMIINNDTGKDKYMTEPVPEGKPLPIEPQDAVISDKELTCTLSVRCDTILENIEWFDEEKIDIVPEDGIIFAEKNVTFYEGESVFNLLLREMKRNKIHLEFENTPIYNSAYIEGISNLYEFDCGELSGWMYKVNGWFPNYGCSRYQLKTGDRVEWVYTCNLGLDVGGHYSAKGE